MPQTTADPTPSSALDEGTQRGEHLLELARGTLNHFEATASAAQSELDDQYMPSPNAFAVINTMTGERAVRGLHTVTQERRRELRGLTTEPAIARLLIIDEAGRVRIAFVSRAATPRPVAGGPLLISYRSPMGRLAAIRTGEELEVSTPSGELVFKLAERAALNPIRAGEWNSVELRDRNAKRGADYHRLTAGASAGRLRR